MLDHGVLNLPLAKRSDTLFGLRRVDVEAVQRKQAKDAAAQRKALKVQAKALLVQHEAAIVARHGEKFGVKALRHQLDHIK